VSTSRGLLPGHADAVRPAVALARLAAGLRQRALAIYIATLVGVGIAWLALIGFPSDLRPYLATLVVLTVTSVLLEFVAVPLAKGGVLSMATITHVATILLLPPALAAASIGVAVAIEEVLQRTSPQKLVFNVASFVVTALLAASTAGLVGNLWLDALAEPRRHAAVFLTIAIAGGVYYLVNALLLCGVLTLVTGDSFWRLFRINTRDTGLSEFGGATVGGLFGLIWVVEPVWTPLLAMPAAVISRSLHHIRRLHSETQQAVRSLAEIVDHRDRRTFHHSERVALYATALARELGLEADTVELIEQAAAVHDLGKIAVPDHVLLKPGPLNTAERASMWRHTVIGAEILGHYELFRAGSQIVRHHHEAWDGSGYPEGLVGEQIPLGARVVAVADAFDAMTSDRPYRTALSVPEAVRRLRVGAGIQWDPVAVGAFLRLVLERRLPAGPDAAPIPEHVHLAADLAGTGAGELDPAEREQLRDLDHPPTAA
jgi:putative nucleotidyltransferase with HDIG domain